VTPPIVPPAESISSDGPSKSAEEIVAVERIFSMVAALIATIIGIWTWHLLRTNLVKGCALAALIVMIYASSRIYQARRKGRLRRESVTDLVSVGVLCICGTVAMVNIVSPLTPATQPGAVAAINVLVPQPADSYSPLPTVTCPQRISGQGNIPHGYQLIVGYRKQGSGIWAFWPWVTWKGNQWSSVVYIGERGDTNAVYFLAYEIIPVGVSQALLDARKQVTPKDNWWTSTQLPPLGILTRLEKVRRSPAEPNC
jgi:hypothetical protein